MAGRGGWRTVAARRGEGADQRFLESEARIAVVDARDALFDGLEALRLLASPTGTTGAALVVLLGRKDRSALDTAYQAGATHYLVEPFTESDYHHSLRFAERHARRVAGHWKRASRDGDGDAADAEPEVQAHDTRDVLTSLYNRLVQGQEIDAGLIDGVISMSAEPTLNGIVRADSGMASSSVMIRTRKKTITPRTAMQADYMRLLASRDVIFALGPAGTGKTYLAVAQAVSQLITGSVQRLILSRPAVEAG